MLNLPNFLTLLRILSIPIFLVFLADGEVGWALVVFIAGGVTDSLDGAIARLTNTRTALGAYMDPIADKMLLISTFVVLALMEVVPLWLVAVVISRDVVIVTGYIILFLLTQELMEIRPSVVSKTATFLQLSTLSCVLLRLWWAELLPEILFPVLYGVTGVVTAITGFQYVFRGLRWYHAKIDAPA